MKKRIVIFGAGSVGCWVAGTLMGRGHDVTLVGRKQIGDEIAERGLTVLDGAHEIASTKHVRYDLGKESLASADVILVTTKSGALSGVAADIAMLAQDSVLVVTLQNGIDIAARVAQMVPRQKVLGGIVGFNIVRAGSGRWSKSSSGVIHCEDHPMLRDFGWHLVQDLRPVEWGKLLLNLNNAINALSGQLLKQQLQQLGYRQVLAAAMVEAMAVAKRIGVKPAKLGPVAPALLSIGLRAPNWFFNTVLLPRQGISDTARLSMSADYDAGRPTEIAELNGRVVSWGREVGIETPVNTALAALILEGASRHHDAKALLQLTGLRGGRPR
jgi:2-dehydropantoate 2-reductase